MSLLTIREDPVLATLVIQRVDGNGQPYRVAVGDYITDTALRLALRRLDADPDPQARRAALEAARDLLQPIYDSRQEELSRDLRDWRRRGSPQAELAALNSRRRDLQGTATELRQIQQRISGLPQSSLPAAVPDAAVDPVYDVAVRSSDGGVLVSWQTADESPYMRVGRVNLTEFLSDAGAGGNWGDAIAWQDLGVASDHALTFADGFLTTGDLYAFAVTAAAGADAEQHWPDPNWIAYRVRGGDTATSIATPTRALTPTAAPTTVPTPTPAVGLTPTPTVAPPPTPAGPDSYCDTPIAFLLPQCQ